MRYYVRHLAEPKLRALSIETRHTRQLFALTFLLMTTLVSVNASQSNAQGLWSTAVAPLATARYGLVAATGPDGHIYAIGGGDPYQSVIDSTVESYDTAANTWTTVSPMLAARYDPAATVGPDGRIYAIGGYVPSLGYSNTVEAYNTNTNTWTSVAPMPTGRYGLAAAAGQDGRIYAIGGYNSSGYLSTVEAYNINTNTWTSLAPIPIARYGLAAATGPDGRIYAIGGYNSSNGFLSSVEAYNVNTNTWTSVAATPTVTAFLAATTGADGRIFAVGGQYAQYSNLNAVEAYNVYANTWTSVAPLPAATCLMGAATGLNGAIYAIGGSSLGYTNKLDTVEAYIQETMAPIGLAAASGNNSVSLSWTASLGAASYSVYRSTTAGVEQAPALASGVVSTSYIDTSVSNGTTYYYTAVAIGSLGASVMSNEASATPLPPTPTVIQAASATPNPVSGTTAELSTLGEDIDGESTLTYTWSSTGPAVVTYSDNGDNTAKNATAAFTAAGTYTITVTITDSFGQSATSQATVIVEQTYTSIVVTPGPTLTLGPPLPEAQQFTATALDQFGNPLLTQPTISWALETGSVGSIGSTSGLYHSGAVPGSATVKVKGGTLMATCAVMVNPAPVTVATVASALPNPVTDTTTSLSALGAYAGSGGAGALTYMWSSTGPDSVNYSANGTNAARSTIATFTQAGSYTFTVTISSPYTSTTTSSVIVTVDQTLTSIVLTPGPTLAIGSPLPQTQQFTATANDQFGNTLSTQPTFVWSLATGSVGSISDAGGLYHTGKVAGSATVRAKSGAVMGTCAVTIN